MKTTYLLRQSNPFGPISDFTSACFCSKSSTSAPFRECSKSIHLTSPFFSNITFLGVPTPNAWTSPWNMKNWWISSRYWRAFAIASSVALQGRSISPSRYSNMIVRCSPWSLRSAGTFALSGYTAMRDCVLPKNKGTTLQLDSSKSFVSPDFICKAFLVKPVIN